MLLIYPLFYTKMGVRRLTQFRSPAFFELTALPRSSAFHYTKEHDGMMLDTSFSIFKDYTTRIQVDYQEELIDPAGSPRKVPKSILNVVRPFHMENKRFQYRKDAMNTVTDAQMLTVINYTLLDDLYRYPVNPLSKYFKWKDYTCTVLGNINKACATTSKHHFLEIDTPELLPSVQMLNNVTKKEITVNTVKVFNTEQSWWVMEFWKFMDPSLRSTSILSLIDPANYSSVVFLFKTLEGKYAVVNLGYLNSYIDGQENQTEFKSVMALRFEMFQKLFLLFCMSLKRPMVQETAIDDDQETVSTDLNADEDDTLSHTEEPEQHEDIDGGEEVQKDTPVSMATKNKNQGSQIKSLQEIENSDGLSGGSIDFVKQLKDLDEDLKGLDIVNRKKLEEAGLKIDGTEIQADTEESNVDNITQEELDKIVYEDQSVYTVLEKEIDQAAEIGLIPVADMRKLHKLVQSQPDSKDPYGSNKTLQQASLLTPEDLAIDEESKKLVVSSVVQDESMRESTLNSFGPDYIKNNLRKDVLNAVVGIQKSGVIVRKHQVEEQHSALGSFEIHTLELKPVGGNPSTIRMKLPMVDDEGVFKSGGCSYSLRCQRADVPIRKISPTDVGLTSYYGKVAVSRSTKKANSSLDYVKRQLNAATVSDHPFIKNVAPAFVFDNEFVAPFIYNGLADSFKSFNAGDIYLTFDHIEREQLVPPEKLASYEKSARRVCGKNTKGEPVVVDNSDHFFLIEKTGTEKPLGDIFDILQLNHLSAPVDFAEVRVFSKSIPVGLVLAYTMGFRRLVKFLKARFRTVEGKKQKGLQPYEYSISFLDKSYIFDRRDKVASLVLAGFDQYEKRLKSHPSADFDHRAVYVELLESQGLSSIYIREIELREQLFVDPITRDTLISMKEPTTFKGLLVRSCELLTTYHHPISQDHNVQRIRGYERFAGVIYKSLAMSIRQFKNKNIAGRSKVDMSPYEVWNTILKDPAVKIVEDINPIQNVKATEIVTYVGEGGRAKESMNKMSRAYHKSDIGVTSEATVDSTDVGINYYLAANPGLSNQRGVKNEQVQRKPSNLFSVSAMMAVGSDLDDPRRVAFVTHQNSHTVAAIGYEQSRVRTGYEYVLGQRTGSMFCASAKQDGKVLSVDDAGIVVEYKDGTTKGFALGRQYGKAEGSVYPHDIVCNMKPGQSFKKGDVVCYNTGFFEKDVLDPKAIVYKGSLIAKTVFYESAQTLEDSSAISVAFGKRMSTYTTKIKSYTVEFTQSLRNIVKPGQAVDPNSILMLIEDEITASSTAFDEKSLELLTSLSKAAPRSGYLGTVDKIEVFYHGDKADMSPSLKLLADASDRRMMQERKAQGLPPINGSVNDDYRVEGTPLILDKAEVRIYLNVGNGCGSGDKLIFSNQLKSTIGEVMDYTMTTEDGQEIEAVFGFRSNANRIIASAMMMGTTATLLKVVDAKAVNMYFGT